jgi:hypothetical protein
MGEIVTNAQSKGRKEMSDWTRGNGFCEVSNERRLANKRGSNNAACAQSRTSQSPARKGVLFLGLPCRLPDGANPRDESPGAISYVYRCKEG